MGGEQLGSSCFVAWVRELFSERRAVRYVGSSVGVGGRLQSPRVLSYTIGVRGTWDGWGAGAQWHASRGP